MDSLISARFRGGGWLAKLGALDFAGGAVVHLAYSASGLACAVALGRRRGYRTGYMAPHSLPLTLVGSGLLWIGWFGFNGGSARGGALLCRDCVQGEDGL